MAVSKENVPVCAHIPKRHCPTYSIGVAASVTQPGSPFASYIFNTARGCAPLRTALRHHPASPLKLLSHRPGCRLLPSRACRTVHWTRFALPSLQTRCPRAWPPSN